MKEGAFLDVPGGRLYYEVEGDGPALTLIHAGIANLRQWDEQVPAFAERYRVIRYDTRGYGRTTTDDVAFSNRDDLRALLDHLGVERTHLLGLSRGSMIALDLTLESPERVSSLIWVAGGIGGFDGAERTGTVKKAIEEMERLWEAKDWDALAEVETRLWQDGPDQPADRVDPELRDRVRGWILANYRATNGVEGQPIPLEPKAIERLGEISVPLLVMLGDLDEPSVAAGAERLAADVRDVRRHVFPGVAHMVNLERPDEFTRVVLGFLAEVEAHSEVPV